VENLEIIRAIGPKTVLDASGRLTRELRQSGIEVDESPRHGVRYDLAMDVAGAAVADAVLIAGEDLLPRVEEAAGAGFAPDTKHSRAGAVLMRRGPAWPAEAVRYFVESLERLEAERKLNGTLRDIQAQLSRDADDLRHAIQSGAGSVDESRLRAMEESLRNELDARFEELKRTGQEDSEMRAHLARIDRKLLELNRGMQALSGRIDGIFASRTWQALTAAGGVLLRVTGRKT
jgi:hypothetical protein